MSEEEDWKSTVNAALVRAKQELAVAWALVDEVGAEPAVEEHLTTALGAIDRAFATTAASTPGADAMTPSDVQFWEQHGALPGFALGS
jgi:hypothetical protein